MIFHILEYQQKDEKEACKMWRNKNIHVEMIRSVDDLGRVVIPKELRSLYGINRQDKITVVATRKGILLVKAGER